ncbi:MAG: S41 family peptidase [Candidatus Latescibacteria bacterium]|jgi:carboxyl-terminal processing protease|nr:S41 family peptidase [Candidatus Latescibacterota bacterium]
MYIRRKRFVTVVLSVAVFSFMIGNTATRESHAANDLYAGLTLFTNVLKLVNDNYVEKVEANTLIYGAIDGMLRSLDPHSNFLSKENFDKMGENFSGKFYGVGIEFDVLGGILSVISVIEGSPSEAVGLRSGDRIIKINGQSAIGIKNDEVVEKLRGEKGTTVDVTIDRAGVEKPFVATITRDKIPIKSVRASYLLDDRTGYIQMIRFAKTTSQELEDALNKLEAMGMNQLILDLRGNTGGYLDQAVEVSNKFIGGGKTIVSTRGRTRSANQEFTADAPAHPEVPLIILLDHRSASASEIVAGAVQDYDRGVIVGTRSFGKGLVQTLFAEPYLRDGSALKLTTAKYYTPSGRLIQRDYKNKSYQDYLEEAMQDEPDGDEALEAGAEDQPVFETASGRLVYGGGGITPDVKIKAPKREFPFVAKFRGWQQFDRATFEFATDYGVEHQGLKGDFESFLTTFEVDDQMVSGFRAQAQDSGIEFTSEDFDVDMDVTKLQLKRSIARNLWGDEEAHRVAADGDIQLQNALALFTTHAMLLTEDLDQ